MRKQPHQIFYKNYIKIKKLNNIIIKQHKIAFDFLFRFYSKIFQNVQRH